MNIGIRLHDTAPGTLEARLRFAAAQGFSCEHLAMSKAMDGFRMEDAPEKLDRAMADRVREAHRAAGVECAVLGCYLNLADPDRESREKTQEIYRAHLRFAGMIGAGVVGTETYANPKSVFSRPAPEDEEAFRLFMDSLKDVVRFAEEEGAILAVEPVWCHIISTPERAQRMLEEADSDNLQIILDAVNLISPEAAGDAERVDRTIEDAIRRLGDRVRVMHMKDYILKDDGGMEACACGTGCMRYERLLGFAGLNRLPMTLENTVPDNAEGARLFLEKTAKQLQ